MISLLQRVSEARVDIAGETVGRIGPGLLVLVCAEPEDTEAVGQKLLAKILKLRIFSDELGKMNRSLQDVAGGLLIVSQFTLAADIKSGNRPGFTGAAPPALGEAFTTALWRSPANNTPWCRPAASAPTCRCTWSMTGR